ncbi:hypothetical protein EI94DRAFT_1768739 [Lactarius quietus]|nr:hypothetical protein EI94DRAFT_1768739 [Lactarius quietus]
MPWFTESYFSHDHATAAARKRYTIILTLASFVIIVFAMGVLSIYWGSLWRSATLVHHLNGWVVDFDGSDVGQFVSRGVIASSGSPTAMTWYSVSANLFPNGAQDLEHALVQNQAWAIIAINPNVTENLNAALIAQDNNYLPNGTVTAYPLVACSLSHRVTLFTQIVEVLDDVTESFNIQYIATIPDKSSDLTSLLFTAPQLVSQPISYTVDNIRPFDVPVAAAVEFVGLIYMLILAFVVTNVHYAARIDITHLEDRLSFKWLIIIRMVNPIILYFFISCFFSLISLAFQVPFNRFYGGWGFVIYWMMSWLAMSAVGGAVESLITILTPRFVPLFLLLWIISNVSVCVFPSQLLPSIYRYGYAMPFYNVQQTVRAIIFGTRDQIALNFGVQIAWVVVSWCTMIGFQYIKRRQAIRAHRETVGSSESMLEKA